MTGAAVGAGLGLAIGSTTGNAGEGFFLGTMAGAASGAAIGKGFESHERKLREQEELVARQDAVIVQQGRELQELRRSVGDGGSFKIPEHNRPSLGGEDRFRGSAGAKSLDGTPPANTTEGAAARVGRKRGRLANATRISVEDLDLGGSSAQPPAPSLPGAAAPDPVPSDSGPYVVEPVQREPLAEAQAQPAEPLPQAGSAMAGPAQPVLNAMPSAASDTIANSSSELPAANTLPPARQTNPVGAAASQGDILMAPEPEAPEERKKSAAMPVKKLAAVPALPAKKTPPKKKPAEVPVKTEQGSMEDSLTKELAAAVPSEGPCTEAEKEAARGVSATSDADKLFYFRRAIRLCPEVPEYYVQVGRVYVNIGRTEDAQHEFNKALELDPDNTKALEELNMIMLGQAY